MFGGALVPGSAAPAAPASSVASEVRLEQMRQRVYVAQPAVLDAEEMRIGRAAAAAGAPAPNV